MRRWNGSLLALVLAMLITTGPTAADDAPALTALAQFRTEGMPLTGPFEVAQVLARFPPASVPRWIPMPVRS